MAKKETVAVYVPTGDGMLTSQLHNYILELHKLAMMQGAPINIESMVVPFKHPVDYARNVCVGTFLESDADWLFFIDADMLPKRESSLMFGLIPEADVIVGRYFVFDRESDGTPYLRLCAFDFTETGPNGEPTPGFVSKRLEPGLPAVVDIDGAGTGCLLIHRRVLEDERMWGATSYTDPYGNEHQLKDAKEYAPPLFKNTYAPNGKVVRGEDVDFVFRAKRLGYRCKAHLMAEFGHVKRVDLDAVGHAIGAAIGVHEKRQKEMTECESVS